MTFAGHNRGKHFEPGEGWVKGRIAARVLIAGLGHDIKCPFCGTFTNSLNDIKRCPECGRRWFQKRNGDYVFVD